jgi:hypothetical protein
MRARFDGFPPVRTIALGLLWLALFSLLDTLGEQSGAWPTIALGRMRDLDLVVGFLAVSAGLVALLRNPRRSAADPIG